MCYTQHSTASRSVSDDNKNVLHTALHSGSLRLWGQQECVTHSTPQRVAPSLGTTRMCYTQHSTAGPSVSGDNKNVLHTALHSGSLRLWETTRMCYKQHSTASSSVSGDNKNVLHTAPHSELLRLWGQQECFTHSTPQRVAPSLGTTRMCYTQHSTAGRSVSGDNKNVLHTALHSESLRLWGQQECVTHSTPQRVAPSLGTTRMCYTQYSTASRSVSGDNENVLHTVLHSESLRLWGQQECVTNFSLTDFEIK